MNFKCHLRKDKKGYWFDIKYKDKSLGFFRKEAFCDESLSIIANTLTDILNTAEEVIHSEDL